MSKATNVLLLTLMVCATSEAFAESYDAYLPQAAAAKAAKMVAAIDKASAALALRRADARSGQLAAEAKSLEAFALLSVSDGGQEAWARPDGGADSATAKAAYEAARAKAKADAASL